MSHILSNPNKILRSKKKGLAKYLFFLLLVAILWFPSNFFYQYSFGFADAGSGSLVTTSKNSILEWLNKALEKQNFNDIERERETLAAENAKLKEQFKEKQIDFKNEDLNSQYYLSELKVIGKDNFLGAPLILLFGGSDDNLRTGLPVLDEQGFLIGTIKSSQQKISQVILTPNHDSRISARIAGTDWNGVLEGNRDLRAILEMLPLESQLKVGDQVVTDNSNPDIPAGIILGSVSSIGESNDHLFKEAILDLPWDSNKMNKVWVINGRK